ncbi:homocitrate synthase [Candidatus Woesearchaeota archaeon]|nr:homocitrate synthase [Candidatus Woesearchaeota archaeon]
MGENNPLRYQILDTTLREGEQTPGVSFSINQKIEIAKLLSEFGVDFIEAGHPVVAPNIKKAVKAIADENLKPKIIAHCRAQRSDIDQALDCGVSWVGIFFSVSDKSLEQRFRKSEEEATKLITDTIQYAKDHGLNVRYTPEDTVRSDFGTVLRVSEAAVHAGADRISIADTGGVMTPEKISDYVKRLKQKINVPLNIHCHNDLGLASANSLSALNSGARLADVTINGLGERCGIADLSQVCTALKTIYRAENNWKLDMLPEISDVVERYSGIKVSKQAPVVGKNAFTHNAGLHVSAMLIDPEHYETIPCGLVGRKRDIVIDKMAGKEAIRFKLDKLGIQANDDLVNNFSKELKLRESNLLKDHQIKRLAKEVQDGNNS